MAKRGHNEGSIYQRESDGKWVASVDLGYGPDGKRRRKVFYGKTRKEVAEKLKTALHDVQRGLPLATDKQTVAQFLEDWLKNTAQPNLRPGTYVGYEVLVRLHITPAIGRIKLTQLAPQHVEAMLNHMREEGLAPRTAQYARAVLRRALGQAVKWDLIPRNAAALASGPKVSRPEIEPLTPAQARAFLAAIKGHRLEALYTVALALGLRRGEALGLSWSDVSLETGTLTVRRSLQRLGGKLQLCETKTDRSHRTVTLPRSLVSALRAHRTRQLEERLLACSRWQETGLVFTSTIGTPIEPRNLNRQFTNLLKAAKMPAIRFHDLRHSCATMLLVQGVSARVVADILGHSKTSTTTDIYQHVVPQLQRDAADRMEELLTGS